MCAITPHYAWARPVIYLNLVILSKIPINISQGGLLSLSQKINLLIEILFVKLSLTVTGAAPQTPFYLGILYWILYWGCAPDPCELLLMLGCDLTIIPAEGLFVYQLEVLYWGPCPQTPACVKQGALWVNYNPAGHVTGNLRLPVTRDLRPAGR